MGSNKKKKRPASNPARGFATTSVASKSKVERVEEDVQPTAPSKPSNTNASREESTSTQPDNPQPNTTQNLSPEELEKQLEDFELQTLVDKHAEKSKRDAARHVSRLQTDRRILRGQADALSTRRWLSQELMDELLETISQESRSNGSDTSANSQLCTEEELIMRLWTLQQVLQLAEFPDNLVKSAMQHVLDIYDRVLANTKDSLWGFEEAMDWLARESTKGELMDYDVALRKQAHSGKGQETPGLTPSASGTATPEFVADVRHIQLPNVSASETVKHQRKLHRSKATVDYDSDIDPDDLLPAYIATKTKLFELGALKAKSRETKSRHPRSDQASSPEVAKLQRKVQKIENDILFDKFAADLQWENKRIILEREAASQRATEREHVQQQMEPSDEPEDEVSREAARIAAEILNESSSDEDSLGIFHHLIESEVDPVTGKTSQFVNDKDGTKVTIRDFGVATGVSPQRILAETCRSRDTGVKVSYDIVSATTFANRCSVTVKWSKPQETPSALPLGLPVESSTAADSVVVTMKLIAAPELEQAKSYIATAALFFIFGSRKDITTKLPPSYRDLWTEFTALRKGLEDSADKEVIRSIKESIRAKRDREEEDGIVLRTAFRNRNPVQATNNNDPDAISDRGRVDAETLQRIWTEKSSSPSFQKMLKSRIQLPMWSFKSEVLAAIDREQVVIICGETGCGKSTQVPAFILEHQMIQGKPCKVYCTEGIVMRMLEGSNDLRDITHVVLDEVHERSIDSDFLLIVLRKLLSRRPDLKVVLMSATVDAERFSKYLDGAPILHVPGRTFPVQVKYLEDAVELTGYTIDDGARQDRLAEIDDDIDEEPTNDNTPGDGGKFLKGYSARTRATISQMDEYRIDFDLITLLIEKVASDDRYSNFSKAILVFLPGIAEIRQLNDMLSGHPRFSADWDIYPLHSTIASEDQEAAFLIPPEGRRKIVLATNIAETGITIPDVTCVIDTGKHKEMRFDERRQLSRLLETFISRANAKQRRGRAGRVQEGLCFHLFTKHRHDERMPDQQTPEFLRLSLQDLAIRVKICKLGSIEEVLAQALDAPSAKNIRRAVDALVDVRALTPAEVLTPLGQQLARLPLDVFLGKLIIYGSFFKCLDATVTIAAILSSKSPFTAPFGARSQAETVRLGFKRGDSDVLTAYNAYVAWRRVCMAGEGEFQFCRKNFLSMQNLASIEDLKGQLVISLVDAGFLVLTDAERSSLNRARFQGRRRQFFELPRRVNTNSNNDLVTSSVVAWSFYPKLLTRDGKGWRNVANNQTISLHPTSVNRGNNDLRWMSYYHIMQARQFYNAHETTSVDEFAIALLCGDVRFDMFSGVIILDGNRARFSISDWKTMLVVKVLRTRLRESLTRTFKYPGKPLTSQQQRWMDLWQKIFCQEFDDK